MTRTIVASRPAIAALCCSFMVLSSSQSLAQAPARCNEALADAEAQYIDRRFDDVITTLAECLDRDDVLVTVAVEAYRLVALAYIQKDEADEARLAIRQLLNRMPSYEPDPIRDIPAYVALVHLARRDLELPATATRMAADTAQVANPEEGRRSWFRSTKGWLITGGSAALAGVVMVLMMDAGESSEPATLPMPPALPN